MTNGQHGTEERFGQCVAADATLAERIEAAACLLMLSSPADLLGALHDAGLHVVSAADKAVLDAGHLVLDSSLRRIADENGGCLADWARAELARREVKP